MGCLEKERRLLKTEITLLRDILAVRERAAGERLQDAMGEVKELMVPSAPEMVDETSGEE